MGTYYIPRNVKGESRILYIFTVKALLTTAIGGTIGFLFYLLFANLIGWTGVGITCLVVCAVLGYGIGAIKIPVLGGIPFTKNVGGESLMEIISRYVKFKAKTKVYTYLDTKEEEK